jgi:hypothetical protein
MLSCYSTITFAYCFAVFPFIPSIILLVLTTKCIFPPFPTSVYTVYIYMYVCTHPAELRFFVCCVMYLVVLDSNDSLERSDALSHNSVT